MTLSALGASGCRRCARLARPRQLYQASSHSYSTSSGTSSEQQHQNANSASRRQQTGESKESKPEDASSSSSSSSSEPGAMTRRLQEATEDALLTGGKAGQRAVEDAGFSEELREKLLNKVKEAKFRNQFSAAFAEAGLTSSTSSSSTPGSHHIATAQPWTGEEPTQDAVLRMLDDSKKKLSPGLRGKFQTPEPVDMRIKRDPILSPSQRVASARDKASTYAGMDVKAKTASSSKGLTPEEREELRQEFRERFQPGARAMPNSITGLAALANERIENAIARGQFKDIPRGTGVERDARADNPFIDTTEYIMNKMIQRQDIVPPWIEKQQDLAKAANTFRTRLRNDWKRHAARMIASEGGSLLQQMRRAEAYARSESVHNPRARKVESVAVPTSFTDDPVMVQVRKQKEDDDVVAAAATAATEAEKVEEAQEPLPRPFRDPEWEKAENAYMKLSIENLNNITRAYNLMAPDLAKKPYYFLERELLSAFAEVAPQLANEIKERATRPTSPGLGTPQRHPGERVSFIEHLSTGDSPPVRLEAEEKAYGMKEWWRDLWKK